MCRLFTETRVQSLILLYVGIQFPVFNRLFAKGDNVRWKGYVIGKTDSIFVSVEREKKKEQGRE